MKIRYSLIGTGLIVSILTAALPAFAVDYYWNTATNGVFSDDGNWRYYDDVTEDWVDEGVPGDNDWVFFDNDAASAYTVTLTLEGFLGGYHTLNAPTDDTGLKMRSDKVILNLAGEDLTFHVFEDNPETKNFLLSTESGDVSDLTIQGGGTFTAMNSTVGVGGTSASLTLIGTESQATVLEFSAVGDRSSGHSARRSTWGGSGTHVDVEIRDNAELVFNTYQHFNNGGGVFTATIGDGGTLTSTGHIRIGRGGTSATVNVNAGGLLDVDSIDTARGAATTINVNGGTVENRLMEFSIRGAGTTINVTNGGAWTSEIFRDRNREHSSASKVTDILIEGDDGNGNASLIEVTGTGGASLGIEDDGDAKAADRTHLTVRDGGQFDVTHGLKMTYMAKVAIDDGSVDAGSLLVTDGVDIGGDMYFASYALTLYGHMIGEPAPFQVTGDAQIASDAGEADRMDFEFLLDGAYTPEIGDSFTILSYGGDLIGYFRGMAPNSSTYTFWQDDVQYQLDYAGDNNTAITLTVIPEPHTLGLFLAAGALLAFRRRGKR